MKKYSATIQFKETRAQWTLTTVKRADGKGYSAYGLEAENFDEAVAKTRDLFRAQTAKETGDFSELVSGEPETIIIMQEEPREVRTVKWDEV